MKTPLDPRHQRRIRIMQDLFALGFNPKGDLKTKEAQKVRENLDKIDREVAKAAPTWPLDQINKVDLAILRLAIFELIIEKEQPFKVVVDEAVELAKEFGSDSSPTLINGALGNVITTHGLDGEKGKENQNKNF